MNTPGARPPVPVSVRPLAWFTNEAKAPDGSIVPCPRPLLAGVFPIFL